MTTNEITPAQHALLQFIETETATTLHHSIADALSDCMVNGANQPGPNSEGVTPSMSNSCYYLVALMRHLHDLETENKKRTA
jgi:hypothetical protein